MQLLIKNKWLSFGGSSSITDVNGNQIYVVKGKVFTLTKKKMLYDMNGKLLYIIRNKFWRLFTRRAFIIAPEGNIVCRLNKKYFTFRNKFWIDEYKDNIEIDGNVFNIDYKILRNGQEIGHLSRSVTWGDVILNKDTFELDIEDEKDAAFISAIVIALDIIYDKRAGTHV